MPNHKRKLTILAAVLGLITLACSTTTLSVANQSEFKALVSVTLPGANSTDSHIYQPGEVYDYYASGGGTYTISVIPQEDYVAEMDKLRMTIIRALYTYEEIVSPKAFVELTEQLARIDRTLSSLTTHSCQGNLMEDAKALATIQITKQGQITLYCPSVSAAP